MKIAHETVDDVEVYWLDFSQEIRRGCELLDERFPGWVDRVDLGVFRIVDGVNCVLGQVFVEEFVNGLVRLYGDCYAGAIHYLWGSNVLRADREAERHGFTVESTNREVDRLFSEIHGDLGVDPDSWRWSCLGEQWIDVITARQALTA